MTFVAVAAIVLAGCSSPKPASHPSAVNPAPKFPPATTSTSSSSTTSTTLPTIPIESGSATAQFSASLCSLQPVVGTPSEFDAITKGSVITPAVATQDAGQVELEVIDTAGGVISTGLPFQLSDGAGSYFFTVDSEFPAGADPASCELIWLAPTGTGGIDEVPASVQTTTPTTYPPLP